MRHNYHIVFVVLVYKNIEVLKDFFESLHVPNSKVVVVNSYYDDSTLTECRLVSERNNADFIAIPNKGYGYGNNIGTQHVMAHYDYDFLVVSNSDIVIREIGELEKYKREKAVIAPKTVMKTGKHQNPDTPWELKFIYPLLSYSLNHKSKVLYTICHICTRLNREVFKIYSSVVRKNRYRIFSAHGSFIIFTREAVEVLYPFFDNEMFLYNEEWYLAIKARNNTVPIYYIPSIEVLHLEGASSGSVVFFEHDKQSFNIFNKKRKNNLIQ